MLAGLIGVLVFMLFYISSDTDQMNSRRQDLTHPVVHPLTNLDMTLLDDTMARATTPYHLDLENTNRLLNPMEWQKSLDGTLILAASKTGLQVAVVTNIFPLYTIVWLDSVITNELGVRYVIKVQREAASAPSKRHPVTHYVSKDEKPNSDFGLLEVKGPPENPSELVLKLEDTTEPVTIAKDRPYKRVDAFSADFRYDPERKIFRGSRAGDKLSFGGVDYTVVDVHEHELILMDQSNQKKTSLPFAP
ncbi:MAG: hypothetical protein ABSH48_17625 [Verrucomicrobiota bacterium]